MSAADRHVAASLRSEIRRGEHADSQSPRREIPSRMRVSEKLAYVNLQKNEKKMRTNWLQEL
jgi:hypothetical protein